MKAYSPGEVYTVFFPFPMHYFQSQKQIPPSKRTSHPKSPVARKSQTGCYKSFGLKYIDIIIS